jgi:hypothetical protein
LKYRTAFSSPALSHVTELQSTSLVFAFCSSASLAMRDQRPETCSGLGLSRARHTDDAPRLIEFACGRSGRRNRQGCWSDAFALRNQESVALTGMQHELTPLLANNLTADGELEVPVMQSGMDFADHTVERLIDDARLFKTWPAIHCMLQFRP